MDAHTKLFGVVYKSEAAKDPVVLQYALAMNGFLSKQPNGLYCFYSPVLEYPIVYNMDLDTIRELNIKTNDLLNNAVEKPFSYILDNTSYSGLSIKQRDFHDMVVKMSIKNN